MKYLFSIILVVLSIITISAQGVYLNVGSNFTTYDYTNSLGGSSDLEPDSGSSYEVGYISKSVVGNKVDIATGITLDQYNASGGNMVNNYSWNTNYLGIQGVFKYKILDSRRSPVAINAKAGINFNHIISGEQKINGQTFNITTEEEFKGLFVRHLIGLEVQYYLRSNIAIGISYQLTKNYGLSRGDENLNFNNRQLQFAILMSTK